MNAIEIFFIALTGLADFIKTLAEPAFFLTGTILFIQVLRGK